jgi:hypothetical protein
MWIKDARNQMMNHTNDSYLLFQIKTISIIACYGEIIVFFVEWLYHIIIDLPTNFDHYFQLF